MTVMIDQIRPQPQKNSRSEWRRVLANLKEIAGLHGPHRRRPRAPAAAGLAAARREQEGQGTGNAAGRPLVWGGTMKFLLRRIDRRRDDWKQNPFFELLAAKDDMGFLAEFSRRLSLWALASQDVRRAVAGSVRETALRGIAIHQAAEDRNLEARFLRDMASIGVIVPGAGELFHDDHAPARCAAYAILAEVNMARTEPGKIAVLLALEAATDVFFVHTAGFVRRMGFSGLEYYSEDHLKQRSTFEVATREIFHRRQLDAGELREVLLVVDSCFEVMDVLFRDILDAMSKWKVRHAA